MPEPWHPFEEVARDYEAWYETRRGQRADQAERGLLEWLVGQGPGAETVLEVGCGTGHFAAWLERRRHRGVGLDRSPEMLAELHRWHPRLPVVLGDGHTLPFRDGAVDMTLFVTTLEFLERPAVASAVALREAVRGVSPGVGDRRDAAPSWPMRTTGRSGLCAIWSELPPGAA